MNFRILVFQLLMLLFFSCTSKDANERIIYEDEDLWLKKGFYPDGSIKVQHTIKETFSDSFINHGFVEYFYPSGSLRYRAELDNGNKIGNASKFYESGQVKEVWFYNPVGQALYSAHFNKDGEIIKELAPDQKFPQVIYKHLEKDSVELKVYSVDFPNRKKNVYLINGSLEVIDSVLNSKSPYDLFVFDPKYNYYQINADYYDIKTDTYIETDNLQFSIEE